MEFEWNTGNIRHIALHGVSQAEAEQALSGVVVELHSNRREGEVRSILIGRTSAGRYLRVIITIRHNRIRVVTAYTAKKKWRQLYERRVAETGQQD